MAVLRVTGSKRVTLGWNFKQFSVTNMPSKHAHDKCAKMDGDTMCTFISESPKVVHLIWKANVFLIKANVFVKNLCNFVKEHQCSTQPRYLNEVCLVTNKVGHYS